PEKVRIPFDGSEDGVTEFWKMIGFLASFKELVDLGEFQGKYRVVGIDEIVLKLKDLEEKARVKEVIEYAIRSGVQMDSLAESAIHTERKKVLEEFRRLLYEDGYVQIYESVNAESMLGIGEEAVWHH